MSEPGWVEIQNFYADQINEAILRAANDDPEAAELNRLHVLRWNAKRELNDAALQYINSTRNERDRILEIRREEEANVHSTYA